MELYNKLVDNNIILRQECTLKSGIKSDYYVDIKKTISIPLFSDIIEGLYTNIGRLENLDQYAIIGVPYSGIPYASVLAYRLKIPLLLMRLEQKEIWNEKKNRRYNKKHRHHFNRRCDDNWSINYGNNS